MKPINKYPVFLLTACLALAAGSPAAQADTTDEEIRLLREQLQMMSERLDRLEEDNLELRETNAQLVVSTEEATITATDAAETAELAVAQMEEQATQSSWTDTLRWTGDFRFRHERIGIEDLDTRTRNRIRARAALIADVYDEMEVGIGIASGGVDPVSSNQTLGGGGSTKDLGLDLAYFKWKGLTNTSVLGGKFKNGIKSSANNTMLFDSDWRPEGLAFTWDNESFYVSGLGTWLESDSKTGEEFAWIGQAGFRSFLGDSVALGGRIGYHQFDSAGAGSFFGDDDFFGNSYDPLTLTYLYDYRGVTLSGDVGFELFGKPTLVFVDFVQNQAVDDFNTGYIFGVKLGSANAPGTWDLGYAYEDLEADAAFGLLVDSDFGGGGTDARGHIFKGTWAFRQGFSAKFTYFINKIDGDLGTEKDFDRLMLDLNFKF